MGLVLDAASTPRVVVLRASTAARFATEVGLSNPPRLATAAASPETYASTGPRFAAVVFSATVTVHWFPSARGFFHSYTYYLNLCRFCH